MDAAMAALLTGRNPRIAVVGGMNMDLSIYVDRLPAAGESVEGSHTVRGPGGKGLNQAVAARRLGASVRLAGMIGTDMFGDELLTEVACAGLDPSWIGRTSEAATGLALIVIGPDGNNMITAVAGANRKLSGQGLPALDSWLSGSDVIMLQLEVPIEVCLAVASAARSQAVTVMLNAAPMPPTVDRNLAELLGLTDLLVVNQTEASRLDAALAGDATKAVPTSRDALDLAVRIRDAGPGIVVVTMGADGAIGAGSDGPCVVNSFPVKAVDTVGAGDVFCAQLAVAWAMGKHPLAEAVRLACAAGALATTYRGIKSSMPDSDEVAALVALHPRL